MFSTAAAADSRLNADYNSTQRFNEQRKTRWNCQLSLSPYDLQLAWLWTLLVLWSSRREARQQHQQPAAVAAGWRTGRIRPSTLRIRVAGLQQTRQSEWLSASRTLPNVLSYEPLELLSAVSIAVRMNWQGTTPYGQPRQRWNRRLPSDLQTSSPPNSPRNNKLKFRRSQDRGTEQCLPYRPASGSVGVVQSRQMGKGTDGIEHAGFADAWGAIRCSLEYQWQIDCRTAYS